MEEECIFCKIVRKEIPVKTVYEDEFVAGFLDIRPRSKGMTIVASKEHFVDFNENPTLSLKVFESAFKIAERIKKTLKPNEISISSMPSQIKHFHVRIYPYYENEVPLIETQPKEVSEDELEEIAKKMREEIKEEIKEEKIEEKKEEIKRTEEDIFWIKRELELA